VRRQSQDLQWCVVRDKGHESKGEVHTEYKEELFHHGDRLPGEAVQSPCLEVFTTLLDKALSNLS